MGVVRDVTVDNLVTAVGNIDTSSLAQDSTLQDVVTAIGNISGGSDPVTNTTVNSLCKDTTGQSIASAISGLGQTLGSDRALIDGSNIGSPATFRSAIGAQANISSNTATVTLSTTKYGSFYYADTTPTVATSRIISIVVTSAGGNNFAGCIMTASGVIRVFGDYGGSSVTVKYYYV